MAERVFVNNHLVKLHLTLECFGLTNSLEYLELLRDLDGAYGLGYDYGPGDEGSVRRWFKEGTEIQVWQWKGLATRFNTLTCPMPTH